MLEQIAAAGFAYDSSICPYGREFAALAECETVHRRVSAGGDLFEVPISAHRLAGLHLPIIGGNWFRQSPEWPLRYAARHWVETRSAPLVAYFHTWEFDAAQPRIAGADAVQALRHYRNLASMPTRVRRWLTDYRFGSVAEHLRFGAAPAEAAASRPAAVSALSVSSALPPAARAPAGLPLTLVIPCFNEVPTLLYLERTLRRFAAARGAGLVLSYVFVDDGSSDGSWPLMRSLFADLPRCTLKLNSSNFLTDLRLNGDATINGSGTILLSNSNNNRIYGDSNAYRLTIGAGQTLRGAGQLGVNQLKITNNGAIVADQTVALTINPTASDPLTNRGTVEVATGSQMTLSGSNLLQDGLAARTVVNGTLTTPLIDLGAGSLSGTGTIIGAVSNSGGAVAPGASPGKLAIQGNYTQGADGSFDVEINGLQQGVEHDWLAITGSASLAGSLRLNFGYTPILGSSFVILTSGGLRTGTFSSLIQPSGWDLVATYNPHDVTLTVAAVPEPETYALMFAGLALVGFAARRRQAASIA